MSGSRNENLSAEAVIYQQNEIRILVKKVADPAGVALLKYTIYGTNGVQYQRIGQEHKINQLNNPFFFHLFRNDELIGIYRLDDRTIQVADGFTTSGFYGRYLPIDGNQQGNGRLLKIETIRYIDLNNQLPHVFYSYIEGKNVRSLRISERDGFQSVTTLKTFVFRRYSPKMNIRFTRLPDSKKSTFLGKLTDIYRNYRFTSLCTIHVTQEVSSTPILHKSFNSSSSSVGCLLAAFRYSPSSYI